MKTYYPTINFLRGLAALLVCFFHFITYVDFRGTLFPLKSVIYNIGKLGSNGVFIFFVISGFVICMSLFKENFKLNRLHRFLFRRFIRIEIPYFFSILFVIAGGMAFALKNNSPYIFNIKQFVYHIFYLIPFTNFKWYNVIYWTLAIEFQFYIIIALLYFLFSNENRLTMFVVLFLFGISNFFVHDNRFVFNYATIFLQGIVLFLLKAEKINFKTGFLLIALCAIATAYLHSIEISLFSVMTVVVIQWVEINNKATNLFGDISYSLYLTHGSIGGNLLYLFSRYTTNFTEKIILILFSVIASLFVSFLFWKAIENPSKNLSKKINIAE